MLETIFSWLVGVVAELLDFVVVAFLGMMKVDLGSLSASFPALKSGYYIFQGISFGLIILIAIWQLFKFFAGSLSEVRDTPVRILIRSAIAGMMVFFGGHFIEIAIELARIPYDVFVAYDPNSNGMTFDEIAENFDGMNLLDGVAVTLGAAPMLVLVLIVLLLIGWNILKLMLEVLERFLLIGVLTYSSPLIFATMASQSTSDIFKRWVGMLAGQCAIMTVSAWMLKLVISGFTFTETDTNILFRLLLTLAMCKIAQRADTYMQQLGIGVATTGGNIMDEMVGIGLLLSNGFRGGRSNHNAKGSSGNGGGGDAPVLGAGPDGSLSRFGGLIGGVSNAAQQAMRQVRNGDPAAAVGKDLGKNFLKGMGVAKGSSTLKDAVTNKDLTDKQRFGKVLKGSAQVLAGAMFAGAPANAVDRFNAARDAARRDTVQAASASAKDFDQRRKDTRYQRPADADIYSDGQGSDYDNSENMSGADENLRREQQASMQTASQFFEASRKAHGLGGYKVDDDGNPDLDDTAKRAGLRLDTTTSDPKIEGRDDVVGDFLAKNYQDFSDNEVMQEYAVNTAEKCPPLAAEQALNNPYNTLEGNDELGDALIKKAYGEQEITGRKEEDLGGKFVNIKADNVGENGRVIHADYVSPDGNTIHYDIHNSESLNNVSKAEKIKQFGEGISQKYTSIQGNGSGTTMHVRQQTIETESGDTFDPKRGEPSPNSTRTRKKRPAPWSTMDPWDED